MIGRALAMAEKVNIIIGSPEKSRTKDNPLTLEEREKAFSLIIKALGIEDRIGKVDHLEDDPSDDVWSENLEKIIGRKAVILTNNRDKWTDGVLGKRGHEIRRTKFLNRINFMGAKIRQLIREGNDIWKKFVPKFLMPLFDKINFEKIVKQTADVIN